MIVKNYLEAEFTMGRSHKGSGRMTVNEEVREVRQGDVLINRPEWAHSLENHTDEVLKVLVFEVDL